MPSAVRCTSILVALHLYKGCRRRCVAPLADSRLCQVHEVCAVMALLSLPHALCGVAKQRTLLRVSRAPYDLSLEIVCHTSLRNKWMHSSHAQVQQAEDNSGDESEWESASDESEDAAAAAAAVPDELASANESEAGEADAELPDASEWEEWDVRRRRATSELCSSHILLLLSGCLFKKSCSTRSLSVLSVCLSAAICQLKRLHMRASACWRRSC